MLERFVFGPHRSGTLGEEPMTVWKSSRSRGLFAAAALTFGLVFAASTRAEVPESPDPIVLGQLDWTGQEITMKVAGEILTRMGYKVEYVTTTNVPLFQAVADGEIHAYLEQWLVTTRFQFNEMVGKGQLEDIGLLGLLGQEALFYPSYVEEKCPGLPNWEALKGCEELFTTPETAPSGRIVDYPEEWTPDTSKIVDALGLDFVAVPAGGEGAIIAEVKSAVARNEPVLVYYWEPTWAVLEYDLRAVQLPKWDEACETDPAWGVNPSKTFDCAPLVPDIKKFVWPGMKDKWPAAYKLLKEFKFTNADQGPLMKLVDVEGMSAADAAKKWVNENEATWKPWVDAATM
ncbi:MAG TPA: ABC transporter substrate-binding protein [Alphaproteobacteria bacterium]|nr:ABC transporter substrate-binding protein [Alphaproteobacteria bacterium]